MWQEARKQEKKIRGLMVDYKKRAERRREFYEKIKLDPAQFVRAYGRPCKINLDPAVAYAAESPQSMMPWQGQTDNMIDRFDVRAHLDFIPQLKIVAPPTLSKREEEEERWCNYESYRIIVENECAGMTEEQALHQIYIDEQFGNVDKSREEEKKKLEAKKAAIAFVYEDSITSLPKDDDDSDSSDTDVENVDLDITLDVDTLNNEQKRLLNECAQQYGMKQDDFVSMLQKDKEEAEAMKLARILEEEKAQFAGRKSRRERRAYKEKRLAGRKLSPPSYAARDSPKYEPYNRSSSSSKSRSRSPERKDKVLFITSFGGDSDDDRKIQGPSLPPNNDKKDKWDKRSNHKKNTTRKHRRSRSRSRSSRSRSSEKRHRQKLSKATVKLKKKNRKYSGSGRSSSSSHSSSRSRSRSRSFSRSKSRSYSSRSRSSYSSRSRSKSPVKSAPPIKRYRRESLSSKSSESESDHRPSYHRGRDGREHDKRDHDRYERSRYDKNDKNSGQRSKPEAELTGKSTSLPSQAKLTPQEKLKRKMQAALSKSFKADKKAEVERTIKSEQERLDREEDLRVRALELRRRERERRHRELGDSSSDNSRSRSRSPVGNASSPVSTKRRRRSKSRSRSRERVSRTSDYR